ncbi:MAG: MFS transporter [Pseudomonadales bacterium]
MNTSPVAQATSTRLIWHPRAISVTHFINDMMQSVLLALYPVLQQFHLELCTGGFYHSGFPVFCLAHAACGGAFYRSATDALLTAYRHGSTLCGLLLLSQAWNFPCVLVAAILIGMGSSVFHPESSRVARMASAGQHGLAQSIFQVGGNAGTAIGPLLAAAFIVPMGQPSVAWVALAALVGMLILYRVSPLVCSEPDGCAWSCQSRHRETGLSPRKVKVALLFYWFCCFRNSFICRA